MLRGSHENGLEGLNGMRDKEVRNFRDKCAAFVKPIGTIRVKKAGLGHFKLKREENQEYNEWQNTSGTSCTL